ncbi:MAG: hypothetical protein R2940_00660 [Syntrophotaleaceae bacterium]
MKRLLIPVLVLVFSVALTLTGLCADSISPPAVPAPRQTPPEKIDDNAFLQAFRVAKRSKVDTRLEIVKKLIQAQSQSFSAEDFYQQVSALEMPDGKELRHVLMEVKKDVGNYLGDEGLRMVLGERYVEGGSFVEKKLLTHRKDVVMEGIDQTIRQFAGGEQKFSVYYSEVGGWPKETPKQMQFAGDIDFNFLCGDLETALKLKQAFDAYIVRRYGRTPEELDIPCTVHGLATGEVYVGLHGQAFAEGVTQSVKKISFGEDGKPVGILHDNPILFDEARKTMILESAMSKTPLADLEALNWPKEPGISLEMIRHFEHDIVKQNVYTDLESFVKAAKYADRSFTALEGDAGKAAIQDPRLRDFAAGMIEHKKSPAKQVELIKQYYHDLGQPLPFDVELAIKAGGKSAATIRANERIIRAFWDDCRQAMWQTANRKIQTLVQDFDQRVKALRPEDAAGAKALYEEIAKYQQMIEVEDRILHDRKAGIHGRLDGDYLDLVSRFRKTVGEFKQKVAHNDQLKFVDPAKAKTWSFSEELIKLKNDFSLRMAAAALVSAPGQLNDVLDYLDDSMLNTLRYGPTKDYETFLRKGQGLYWSEQANRFLKGTGLQLEEHRGEWLDQHQTEARALLAKTSEWMNNRLEQLCLARGIKLLGRAGGTALGGVQSINRSFNQSVASSSTGQAMMQGMMIYNLSQEIPAYLEFMDNGDWPGLAGEFFRRRVPFGGAVERGVMGDYYGVAWETTATLLPPAAIFSAAKSIGESLGQTAWDGYWSEELEIFIDELYENAEFRIAGVETSGDDIKVSQWRLLSVSYRGQQFAFDELLQMETDDAREMAACLQQPSEKRPECFPMEKFRNGLFRWMESDAAFRSNLGKSDPWIQLIEEMEKQPHVGPKLKDHFQYQKYTRWEQLKVEFLQRLQKKLEDRRAGEQSLLSGNLPKMYDELLLIAGKLDIRPQIEAGLDEEMGDFTRFLASLRDYLRGTYRSITGSADVWDAYEQNAAVVTEYLRTYKRIWDGRQAAEQPLPVARQDQGLRILTGPYFLSGRAAADQAAAPRWFDLPAQVREEMLAALSDIKREAGAEPAGLDLKDGAYDRGILDQLTFHDAFREMWKQVNSRVVEAAVDSYLGRELAEQGKPNPAGEPTDQDRALQRFRFHAQRVEELLNSFRRHYGLREQDALTEVRTLRDRALAVTAAICAEAAAAAGSLDSIFATAEAQQETLSELERSLREPALLAKDLEALAATLTDNHQSAEGLAIGIGDDQVAAGRGRETVCRVAEAMKSCRTNSERDRLHAEATVAHAGIKPAFERARGNYTTLEGFGGKAADTQARLNEARQAAGRIERLPEGLATARDQVRQAIETTDSRLHAQAEARLHELDEIVRTAQELCRRLEKELQPLKGTEKGQTLREELKQIRAEIDAQPKAARGCLKEPQARFKSAKNRADTFLNRYAALETNLQRVHRAFLPTGEGPSPLATALEKANLIELLVTMGKGYLEVCTEHLLMAKVCMNNADRLNVVDFSAIMPNVVGMSCQDGAATVAGNRINYQIVSAGQAIHPDWEYRVDSTEPAAGQEISLQESTALLVCFEDLNIPAYLATIDCSWLPGSIAVYDRGQRRGVCDCLNGTVFNPSRSRCIDCNQYYQGYLNAFSSGDLNAAQSWVNEAGNCGWAGGAQGQINAEIQRRNCIRIANNLQAACQANNAQAVSGAMAESNQWHCNLDPRLWQWGNNVIAQHNQRVQQQQAAQQQQNQQNMQNMLNMMNSIMQNMNSAGSQPSPPPPHGGYGQPGGSSNSSSSGLGSSSGSSSGGGRNDCPNGVNLLGVCVE